MSARRAATPPCNCHCTLEPVDESTANRWSDMARAASLTVRRAKAAQRKAQEKLRDGTAGADGSRKDAKAQRVEAAREAVLRELAEKRSKFNAQLRSEKC